MGSPNIPSFESLRAPRHHGEEYFIAWEEHTADILHQAHLVAQQDERIRALEESEAQSREEAFTDPLTGLPNRRMLELKTEQLMSDADREGIPFVAILMDLDDLKTTNDRWGHQEGDNLLRNVAFRFRKGDEWGFVGRIGGDEFLGLFPLVHNARAQQPENDEETPAVAEGADAATPLNPDEYEAAAHAIIERLREGAENYTSELNHEISIGFSAGYAVYDPYSSDRPSTRAELWHAADLMMYEDKDHRKKHKAELEELHEEKEGLKAEKTAPGELEA